MCKRLRIKLEVVVRTMLKQPGSLRVCFMLFSDKKIVYVFDRNKFVEKVYNKIKHSFCIDYYSNQRCYDWCVERQFLQSALLCHDFQLRLKLRLIFSKAIAHKCVKELMKLDALPFSIFAIRKCKIKSYPSTIPRSIYSDG